MANQIILKKSSVAAKAPVATDLEYGELALNYSDGKLYYKKADNSIDAFTAGIGGSGGTQVYPSNTGIVRYSSATGTWESSLDQPSGSLVGTTDTQALSNKTIAYDSNNLTGVQPTLISGTNIKTINGSSILGSGDLTIAGGSSNIVVESKSADYTVVTADANKIFYCTAQLTITLPAATSVSSGFAITVFSKTSVGSTVTIQPSNGTIEGRTNWLLYPEEAVTILSNGSIWSISSKKSVAFAANSAAISTYGPPKAAGEGSLAFGANADASGIGAISIGFSTQATAFYSLAIGGSDASSTWAKSTNRGAIALGGSYASGIDSFAVVNGNSGGSYGAQGANSIAIGKLAKSTGISSISLGESSAALGNYSVALGGIGNQASRPYAYALGQYANANIDGKFSYASGKFASNGDAQAGLYVLRASTTDNTQTILTTDNTGIVSGYNAVIPPVSSTLAFSCLIVAKQRDIDGSKSAAWEVKGLISRDQYGIVSLPNLPAITVLYNAFNWGVDVSAHTSTNSLRLMVTGQTATNIRWVATVQTAELIY